MHWIDIVLIIWLCISAFTGWRMGFVYKLGSLIGLGISIYLASRWTPAIVERFDLSWTWLIVVFFLLLSVLTKLFGLVAWLIDKAFHIVYIIPLTKTANRTAGALLSVFITGAIITATAYIASLVRWSDWLITALDNSAILRVLLMAARAVAPFVSDALSQFIDTQFLP